MSDHKPKNTGKVWTVAESREVLESAKSGAPIRDLTQSLQRSTGAIQSQARKLLPEGAEPEGSSNYVRLTNYIQDNPDSDLLTPWLDSRKQMRSVTAFSEPEEHLIRESWANRGVSLEELAVLVDSDEARVVSFLMELGLARSLGDIHERLVSPPDGWVARQMATVQGLRAPIVLTTIQAPGYRDLTFVDHTMVSASKHVEWQLDRLARQGVPAADVSVSHRETFVGAAQPLVPSSS